ncbi:membrane protein [Spirochaetia bacterium]|nr:membrane protein [Spirochaetia bacterium]
MRITILRTLLAALVFLPSFLAAETFVYKYAAGDKYRILSTVEEEVYLDRRFSHRAEILNRIAVEVTGVQNGKGRHTALFETAERAVGVATGNRSFQWSRAYESVFDRDPRGYLTIDQKYYMPVVRDVPVFPDRDLKPGDTWTAEGHEMHDFRDSFDIPEPYRIPFTANYVYLGNREWKGRLLPAFSVSYRIFLEPALTESGLRPRRIMGVSDQVVYWDFNLGQAVAYHETFRMVFEFTNGRTVEYRGRAEAEILDSPAMNKERIASEITADLEKLGLKETAVRVTDQGVSISMENIQFGADSSVLLPSEKAKLDKIGEILKRYNDRDILVEGHTALAGNAEGRLALSRERAASAADYLIEKKHTPGGPHRCPGLRSGTASGG